MNRLLSVIKWIAIYYGFTKIISFITIRMFHVNPQNFDSIYDTTGVIAVVLTLACYRAEKTEIVRSAPTKKSKAKYLFLIMITLGVILFIYKKRKEAIL